MMRQMLLAATAALALGACNMLPGAGGSGPPLPPLQDGAQAPSTQTPQTEASQPGNLDDATRQMLIANISEQLEAIGQQFASGMAPPAGMVDDVVPMMPTTDHRRVVDLTGGTLYRFAGACDGDCTNVDIEIIDMTTGGVVASDMLPDDYPVAEYTPTANGQYMIRLLMQACTVTPCYAGTRVFEAPAGGEAPK